LCRKGPREEEKLRAAAGGVKARPYPENPPA
jgi:hypothetical protein